MISDLYEWWGSDLLTSNAGDVATVSGTVRGQQRFIRRLLTNPQTETLPPDYIFHPTYGAGLPRMIGQLIDIPKVQALIRAQMLLENVVAQSPAPVVVVTQNPNDLTQFNVNITYNDSTTQTPTVLAFNVSA